MIIAIVAESKPTLGMITAPPAEVKSGYLFNYRRKRLDEQGLSPSIAVIATAELRDHRGRDGKRFLMAMIS